jgi:hypothetical protein
MVAFVPLDITDEDSVGLVMQHADHVTQYQEGVEPRQVLPLCITCILVMMIHTLQ